MPSFHSDGKRVNGGTGRRWRRPPAGTPDARAPDGGDGGLIETSRYVKVADGAIVTTLAASGTTGTGLIDPTDFTISAGSCAARRGGGERYEGGERLHQPSGPTALKTSLGNR
ncbi:MAG: hypothetical protein QM805_16820 [Pseudomonas sp.]